VSTHKDAIGGIIPALITPYDSEGKVNHPSLRALVEKTLSEGVKGFYVGGSTAETFLLSQEERKSLIETVVDTVAGRAFVICHVGSISSAVATDLAIHAAGLRVSAVSAIPPFYYNFSLNEIVGYYQEIASASDTPVILYNFPAFSGVTIDHIRVPELFADPRIIGIKHTSLDLYKLERIKQANPAFLCLSGHDEVFLPALSVGADGAVGSTYNFMAPLFVRIQELFQKGQMEEARELQGRANAVIDVVADVGGFSATKYLVEKQGIACGPCRKPFKPLTAEAESRLDAIIPLMSV
jgi:N-acetylneuraminate lyase